jgi:hypothetical protein
MSFRWRRFGLSYAIGFALAAICEFAASLIPFVDSITWPGVTFGFVTMLLFRASAFDHPRIFAAVAVVSNGLLYGLVVWALVALSSRARQFHYNRG